MPTVLWLSQYPRQGAAGRPVPLLAVMGQTLAYIIQPWPQLVHCCGWGSHEAKAAWSSRGVGLGCRNEFITIQRERSPTLLALFHFEKIDVSISILNILFKFKILIPGFYLPRPFPILSSLTAINKWDKWWVGGTNLPPFFLLHLSSFIFLQSTYHHLSNYIFSNLSVYCLAVSY